MPEITPHQQPYYSISEVSDMTGISAFTLRYYDKCGFFPNLSRNKNNVREFSDQDVAWLRLVDALRKSGLSIEGIQYFVSLSKKGDSSDPEILSILQAQKITLEYQLAEIEDGLQTIASQIDLLQHPRDSEIENS